MEMELENELKQQLSEVSEILYANEYEIDKFKQKEENMRSYISMCCLLGLALFILGLVTMPIISFIAIVSVCVNVVIGSPIYLHYQNKVDKLSNRKKELFDKVSELIEEIDNIKTNTKKNISYNVNKKEFVVTANKNNLNNTKKR